MSLQKESMFMHRHLLQVKLHSGDIIFIRVYLVGMFPLCTLWTSFTLELLLIKVNVTKIFKTTNLQTLLLVQN